MKNLFLAVLILASFALPAQTYRHDHYIHGSVEVHDGEYYRQQSEAEGQRSEYYTSVMQKSDACYANGDYEGAEYYGKQALWHVPHRRWAWSNIIAARIMMDKRQKARRGYTKGYKYLDPKTRRELGAKYEAKYHHKLRRKPKILLWTGIAVGAAAIAVAGVAVGTTE